MIYDKISNLNKYNVVSKNVINFLKDIDTDTQTGRYEIEDGVYASVDVYNTKPESECAFESHKKFIDIQIILSGKEQLDFYDIVELKISKEYNEVRDLIFYQNPDFPINSVQLTQGYFCFLYPDEAHRPQMAYNGLSDQVKKVVVKIMVSD